MVSRRIDCRFVKITRPRISSADRTKRSAPVDSATFCRALLMGTREKSAHRGEWIKNRRNNGGPRRIRLPPSKNRRRRTKDFQRNSERDELAVSNWQLAFNHAEPQWLNAEC